MNEARTIKIGDDDVPLAAGAWGNGALRDDAGTIITDKQAMKNVVGRLIDSGVDGQGLYFVSTEASGEHLTVCIVGNGPCAHHNARIISCVPAMLEKMDELLRENEEMKRGRFVVGNGRHA